MINGKFVVTHSPQYENMTDHRFQHVTVTTGVHGAEQRTSYSNGTLQYLEPGIDMTIEARIAVSPDEVIQGEDAVATHVQRRLEMAVRACPGLTFAVTIGPTEL